jgi:hypothetical protein
VPFDALVMRAITAELAPRLAGGHIDRITQLHDAIYVMGESARGERWTLEWGMNPRFRRIRAVSGAPRAARPAPWSAALERAHIVSVAQPAWERTWEWELRAADWNQEAMMLVLELSGHLTNALWIREDGRVGDAWRRIPPERPGRAIWPGIAYQAPPAPADPCQSGNPAELPPWARRLVANQGTTLDDLCRRYADHDFQPHLWPGADGGRDLWVLPGPGTEPYPGSWSDALGLVVGEQERRARLEDARRQALATLRRKLERLEVRQAEAKNLKSVNPEPWRRLGDSLLALGRKWTTLPDAVPDLEDGSLLPIPEHWRDLPYAEAAQRAYQAYKKERARREAASRLVPRLQELIQDAEEALRVASASQDLKMLQALGRAGQDGTARKRPLPYRRFETASGYEVWVGRTEVENQSLTFRDARPDDLWFHVKQYPGSHVILRCGRQDPQREDILDAAELAALYSKARMGSAIPVDYTRRKHVRKRPHAGPGQVLYTQERTLYVTPDPARLERLGARRDRLAD